MIEPNAYELPPDPFFDETSCPIWSCETIGMHTHSNDDPRLPMPETPEAP